MITNGVIVFNSIDRIEDQTAHSRDCERKLRNVGQRSRSAQPLANVSSTSCRKGDGPTFAGSEMWASQVDPHLLISSGPQRTETSSQGRGARAERARKPVHVVRLTGSQSRVARTSFATAFADRVSSSRTRDRRRPDNGARDGERSSSSSPFRFDRRSGRRYRSGGDRFLSHADRGHRIWRHGRQRRRR